MKTSIFKKISPLLPLGILAFVAFTNSSAYAQSNTPSQNQQELTERVNYSREQLKVLMDAVLNQNPKGINHADYLKKITPFISEVENKMDAFDQYLQNTLLTTLESDINYYNSVVNDKESSADQIAQTLPGLYQRIQMKIEKTKPSYLAQIKALYEIFGDFPFQISDAGHGFSKFSTLNGRSIRLQNTTGLASNVDVFQNYVLPMIAEDCVSFTCITYTASDYAKLLEGVSNKIDADFVVTLADKKTFVIPGLHLNVQTAIAIMKTRNYPKSVLELPVDFQ